MKITKDTKVRNSKASDFVLFVIRFLKICAAWATCPSAKAKRAGFKPALCYESRLFFALLAFFATILQCGCGFAARGSLW